MQPPSTNLSNGLLVFLLFSCSFSPAAPEDKANIFQVGETGLIYENSVLFKVSVLVFIHFRCFCLLAVENRSIVQL